MSDIRLIIGMIVFIIYIILTLSFFRFLIMRLFGIEMKSIFFKWEMSLFHWLVGEFMIEDNPPADNSNKYWGKWRE